MTNNVNRACLKEFHGESVYCKVQRWSIIWLQQRIRFEPIKQHRNTLAIHYLQFKLLRCNLMQKRCAAGVMCRRGCSRSCSGSATATAWWIPSYTRAPVATSSALFCASCSVVTVVREWEQARWLLQPPSILRIGDRTRLCRSRPPAVGNLILTIRRADLQETLGGWKSVEWML